MGKLLLLLILIAGGGWLYTNSVSLVPGPDIQVDGRQVVLDAGDVQVHYRRLGAVNETYMLFGGDATLRKNSPTHASLAGLPIVSARAIASRHRDFHLCRSPGADDAKRLTESLAFVAENGSALAGLQEAHALFEERLRGDGERTCISVSGGQLLFDSAHLEHDGQNLTGTLAPMLSRTKIVLAERVEIEDCQALLR